MTSNIADMTAEEIAVEVLAKERGKIVRKIARLQSRLDDLDEKVANLTNDT